MTISLLINSIDIFIKTNIIPIRNNSDTIPPIKVLCAFESLM